MFFLWIAIKLVFYAVMAAAAMPVIQLYIPNRAGFIVSYALLRFVVGLAAGFVIALLFVNTQNYLVSFGVIRYFEWLLVLGVMCSRQQTSIAKAGWRGQLWVLIGVAGNLGLDYLWTWLVLPTVKFYC